ncbi:GTP-binding protein ERG [Raphanus sativus]|uniref:GTP-binding protein ERG n=1 Tax=Raphanus sativus TaxID=3726 RepID=A0A6J0LFJ0_RAPSA|nr:GTP-binding protein ERG [Raphanus sativus]KAJ4916953.1 GTP-binding protein ERG [Raphanus sativus]
MKAFRSLRVLISTTSPRSKPHYLPHTFLRRFYSAQPNLDDPTGDSVFDSSQYSVPDPLKKPKQPNWDKGYRERVQKELFPEEKGQLKQSSDEEEEDSSEEESVDRSRILAKALLEAALESADDELGEGEVREEDQKSLNVGIIGPPNAGKSSLTNFMVGTKVAAASRKTNTTTHEVLGVLTKGDTQVCFFDTPGLMLKKSGYGYKDIKARVQNAWTSVDLFDVLIVMFDVHRHLTCPDSRVVRLITYMGEEANPKQKRILCMNKVDLVEKKKDLLKVAEEFQNLPAYERYFMISGLKGSGVKDLSQYLMDQAVKKPWEEDPFTMSEEVMKNISLEVVRERLLDHVHQEVPYGVEHRLVDWREQRDGSLRIEQHLITPKLSQRKILVGKGGAKIGRIGIEANEELRRIMNRKVHLILKVLLK